MHFIQVLGFLVIYCQIQTRTVYLLSLTSSETKARQVLVRQPCQGCKEGMLLRSQLVLAAHISKQAFVLLSGHCRSLMQLLIAKSACLCSGGQQPRRHTDICVLCVLSFLLGKFVRNRLGDCPSEHVEKNQTNSSCCSKEKLQRKKIMQTPTAPELIRKRIFLSLKEK